MPEMEQGAIALGLGCDRGTPFSTVAEAIDQVLDSIGAGWAQVVAMASIDLKADEEAMQQLMIERDMPIRFFTPAQLAGVEVPNPSEVVRKYTGTPSVSEAAALLMAGQVVGSGRIMITGQCRSLPGSGKPPGSGPDGAADASNDVPVMTAEVSGPGLLPPAPITALLIEKYKLRGPDGRNATVSVARCDPIHGSPAG